MRLAIIACHRPGWQALPLLVWLLMAPRAAQAAGPELGLSAERQLPEALDLARDVRWAGAESVFLAVLETGGVELPLDPSRQDYRQVTAAGHGEDEIRLTYHIAASADYVAVSAGLFELGWKALGGEPGLDGKAFSESIEDLDVAGTRLAFLGLRRAENREMAPGGGIAWLGSLDLELADLEPVLFSTAGPGARPMDSCGLFEIGAVRFLPDGTLVVVPGAEPGVFLYDRGGKLIHTWETEPLGLDLRCDFDDAQRDLMSANYLAQWLWLNQFRTVEDVLPLPHGPGLVIRTATDAGTRWDLTILRRNRPAVTTALPITSPSTTAHLRGDVRGDRLVFLLYDSALLLRPGPKRAAAVKPHLFILERKPQP